MKIATWNVNSVRSRVDSVVAWLKEAAPDVVCLQELKCTDEQFPKDAFEGLGYNCAVHGQKTYNGVAILSKRPMEDVTPRLPGGDDSDDHARYIEAIVPAAKGVVRVGSIYAPNGNPIGTDKFKYKLAWLERLNKHAKNLLALEEPVALMGDYNVIPEPEDCYDPNAWMEDALYQPESRAALRRVEYLGYTDAFRACGLAEADAATTADMSRIRAGGISGSTARSAPRTAGWYTRSRWRASRARSGPARGRPARSPRGWYLP